MDPISPYRPRVSRETRLLVSAAFLAVVALWVLSRLTLPEPSRVQSGVAPILAPLVPRPAFDELAQTAADAALRVRPRLFPVAVEGSGARPDDALGMTGMRFRGDLAVVLPPAGIGVDPDAVARVIARDDLTGLTVVSARGDAPDTLPATAILRQPERPRYLLRAEAFGTSVALSPVFVGALGAADAPAWSTPAWQLPSQTAVRRGDVLFSITGEWVGLAVDDRGRLTIAPADAVVQMAERLLARSARSPVTLGVELRPLTAGLRTWAGVQSGAAVTWVEEDGPADGRLLVGDVLVAADGRELPTVEHWQRYLADLDARRPVNLRVRRAGRHIDVAVTGRVVEPATPGLGLTLALSRGAGALVTAVQRPSLAAAAGLQAGDVITMIGDVEAPTPAQVRQAARAARAGRPLLVAVRRGTAHHLLTLEP